MMSPLIPSLSDSYSLRSILRSCRPVCGGYRLMREVYRDAKGIENLIRIMEAHAVFRGDEVPVPLSLPYQLAGFIHIRLVGLCRLGSLADHLMRLCHGLARGTLQLPDILLDGLDTVKEPCCVLRMTLPARRLGMFHRARYPVRAVLLSFFHHERHVTIGT